MKAKKQSHNPLVRKDANGIPELVSPNRRTYKQFLAQGLETVRVCGERFVNPEREFKQFRKEIAKKHGSQTGKLKKKHINKERILQHAQFHQNLGDE